MKLKVCRQVRVLSTLALIIFSTGLFSQQVWGVDPSPKENILPPIYIEFGEGVSAGDASELENLRSTMKNFVERTLSHPLIQKYSTVLSKTPLHIRIQHGLHGGLFDDGVSEISGRCGDYRFSRKLSVNIGIERVFDRSWPNLLAHELFHYVHYLVNPDEPRWLREGMALWFEYHVNRSPPGYYLMAALRDLRTPLMSDYEACDVKPAQYGHNFLFVHFIAKNCGGEEAISKIMAPDTLKGRAKLEKILPTLTVGPSLCRDFSKLTLTMELARAQNQIIFGRLPEFLGGDAPRDVFRIWPTSNLWTPDSPQDRNFSKLQLFEPVLLRENEFLPLQDPNIEIFWLEQSSPYLILHSRSKPTDGVYRQFLIRTK